MNNETDTIYHQSHPRIHVGRSDRTASPCRPWQCSADSLCEREVSEDFARRFGGKLTVLDGGEHFYHTPEQLAVYERWLEAVLL